MAMYGRRDPEIKFINNLNANSRFIFHLIINETINYLLKC